LGGSSAPNLAEQHNMTRIHNSVIYLYIKKY
jgi:hypothetical protein